MIKKWFQYSKNQGNEKPTSFTDLLVRVLLKLVFLFEPLIPVFVAYFLNRQLRSWEQRSLIVNTAVRVERIGRFYYKITVHFVLTVQQLESILDELITMR